MQINYYNVFSKTLNRNMEFKVYGLSGKPCIAFPSQNDRFYTYEDMGIINSMSKYIEEGSIQVICVDNYDYESFSAIYRNGKDRIDAQERYFNYIIDEIIPFIKEINDYDGKYMAYGVSLGAYHAVNFFLRRPDLFDYVLALSGIYHIGYFIKDYSDLYTFLNSPIDTLKHMSLEHEYVDLYKKSQIIVCVGQGAWESDCVIETRELENGFNNLGVECWFDYWSNEYAHDWCSWTIQTPHFLYYLLKDKNV